MSDESEQRKLNLALSVSNSAQVEEALTALAAMEEPERRTVLRPHWEDPAGVRSKRDIDTRRGLDAAFNRLAALELAISTGFLSREAAIAAIAPTMLGLLKSRAVARFIDDYSYFQVRLLASRIGGAEIKLPRVPELPVLDASAHLHATVESFFEKTKTLQDNKDVGLLFAFLDSSEVSTAASGDDMPSTDEKGCEHSRFRLWLADQGSEQHAGTKAYFQKLKHALALWIWDRFAIYHDQPEPVQARLAIFDIYWLLKLFNARISTTGDVEYCGSSWLTFVAESPHVADDQSEAEHEGLPAATDTATARAQWYNAKRVLRRALGLACDWIRGEAIEKLPESAAAAAADSRTPVNWIDVFKAELQEIQEHRRERHLVPPEGVGNGKVEPYTARHGLVGLSFSGGGIRSATFNLGILEALKESGILRHVDYLSTVSGGGYIGGWLVANAKRRGYWIRREADWRESIKFLRDYSNYLSPHLGFSSPDTWTMWTTFLRNTLLVQLQVFQVIAACLLLPYLLRTPFQSLLGGDGVRSLPYFEHPGLPAAVLLLLCTLLVCGGLLWRTPQAPSTRPPRNWDKYFIGAGVALLIPASLYVTAGLSRLAQSYLVAGADTYGKILSKIFGGRELVVVLTLLYVGKLLLSLMSVRLGKEGVVTAILAPFGAMVALVAATAALILLLQHLLP